jgi:hypothetical protein
MSVQLHIPDSQLPVVKKAMESAYQELKKRIEPLQKEMEDMEPLLIQLGIIPGKQEYKTSNHVPADFNSWLNIVLPPQPVNGYNRAWRWLQKIEYVLVQAKRAMTSIEIVEELSKIDPAESKVRLMNSVPATLSTAFKERKLTRATNERGEYIYDVVSDEEPF